MDIGKIKNNLVVSSNDLVHAKYDLSLWQKRVFVYAISQLKKDDLDFEPIKMNVSDIIKFFKGSDGIKTYNAILETPKHLDRTIEIPYVTEKGFLRYGFIKLLQKYTIPADDQEENQYIELCFNNDLKPHLLELKEKFLKYDIRNIIELQSTYSFRMFEILKTYEFRKSIELDIDYLRRILEVTTKYKSYKDFRIYIIDKAKEDLAKYCDITFTYEAKKALKGKKIESIIFHIQKNEILGRDSMKNTQTKREKSTEDLLSNENTEMLQREKSTEEMDLIFEKSKVEKLNRTHEKLVLELSPIVVSKFGVGLKVFMALSEDHSEKEIRQAMDITQKAIESGRVGNIAGFFVEAVRGSYKDVEKEKNDAQTLILAQKKLKADALKKTELDMAESKALQHKQQFEKRILIFDTLIKNDKTFWTELENGIKANNMIKNHYDFEKDLAENMKKPMLSGALMAMAIKLRGREFE